MIKDVMVRLDGTKADEIRLAAVSEIAEQFESHVIALYFNILPVYIPEEGDTVGARRAVEMLKMAQAIGDRVEGTLRQRVTRLQQPVELRRFDLIGDALADVATREARAADTFVALRPNGATQDPEHMIEGILFGSGRHLYMVPESGMGATMFGCAMLAWNGSRESARALAEALPYLREAKEVAVVVVEEEPGVTAERGKDAVSHLRHHGINAALHHARDRGGVGKTLLAEAQERKADLIVMGGYGHSRLREWLLGGATYDMLHHSSAPLVIAH